MNRRMFALSLPASAILIGCDTDQKPSSTATLLSNKDVQEAMQSLSSAIGDLEGSVGSFASENWREVVPSVEAATSDVRNAFSKLRSTLGISS